MGKNDSVRLSQFRKLFFVTVLLLGTVFGSASLKANDLPLASSSPSAGFAFDDRPLLLPVQRNFQMAMLTASSELGRSCGKMEAYGWRMNQSEQQRVNQIFNNTVDRLRGLGYVVETQAPTSVSRDITMFTADRSDKHFIFMWSAGELGLVMVLCQSSPSMTAHTMDRQASVQVFQQPQDVVQSTLAAPDKAKLAAAEKFSPLGDWVGSYTCEQGYTGGTLQITKLTGEDFEGVFRFYPTPKNPYVPTGRYTVYGQYDRESHRILINPGKWLERPKDFYNTIMVGSFDPVSRTFSAYFQGIMGCTSFEAKAATEDYEGLPHKAVKKKHKKKVVKKKVQKAQPAAAIALPTTPGMEPIVPNAPAPPAAPAPAPSITSPAPAAPPSPPAAPQPAPAVQPAPTPVAPSPSPSDGPTSIDLPAPSTAVPSSSPGAATAPPVPLTVPNLAPAAPPSNAAPEAPPAPPSPVVPPAVPDGSQKPSSGSIAPLRQAKYIQLAQSGSWFTPIVPQAPPATTYNTTVPPVQPTTPLPQAQPVSPAYFETPVVPEVPQAPEIPDPAFVNPVVNQLPQATEVQPPQPVPQPVFINPYVPPVPPAQKVPDYRPPNYP